jgi:integrase
MSPHRIPTYRRYKPKNLGLVVIDGKQHYLGPYGSPESLAAYERLVQEWLARKADMLVGAEDNPRLTIDELLVAFWKHAEGHYRKPDGSPSGELENLKLALRPLRRLYGQTPAREFGPVALRAVREAMVKSGLGRTTVNARVNRVRRMFKWAASVELIPAAVVQALQTVPGLQRGRSRVKETPGVKPVALEHVEAALPFMPRPVAAMVRLQVLTGCRTGEVLVMRGCDLAPAEPVWEYRPPAHKNTWRGHPRVIPLGPKAQAVVREFLKPDPDAYLFSPRDVVGELHARRSGQRKTKPTPSEVARRRGAPGEGHGRCYDRRGYRQAIVRACRKAGVPGWSPLQLRHTAGTAIRARFGLEAAQAVLGHAKADVTQVYAERDLAKARAVMSEIG